MGRGRVVEHILYHNELSFAQYALQPVSVGPGVHRVGADDPQAFDPAFFHRVQNLVVGHSGFVRNE